MDDQANGAVILLTWSRALPSGSPSGGHELIPNHRGLRDEGESEVRVLQARAERQNDG
jgi:hypothetical protein